MLHDRENNYFSKSIHDLRLTRMSTGEKSIIHEITDVNRTIGAWRLVPGYFTPCGLGIRSIASDREAKYVEWKRTIESYFVPPNPIGGLSCIRRTDRVNNIATRIPYTIKIRFSRKFFAKKWFPIVIIFLLEAKSDYTID